MFSEAERIWMAIRNTAVSSHHNIKEVIMNLAKLSAPLLFIQLLTGCITAPAGPAGPQGATGDTGATGNRGSQGNTGNTGRAGNTGSAGDTGATVYTGATGDTGAKGNTGAKGSSPSTVVIVPAQ
jgi:hypothetical protein